jgi:hypothetical protein
MPYLVSTAFAQFISAISVDGDARATATARRNRIAELLEGKMHTLDIFPTGSMMRGTALADVSDVDVIAVLHYGKHVENRTCMQVLESVREALSSYNAQIVKKNGQAVTLYFKSWPNVDIVPAKRVTTTGGGHELWIPDTNTGEWIRTDPASLDALMRGTSQRRRQLVRIIKYWNAAHSSYLRSFHIDHIALTCTSARDGDPWEEDDWPWAVLQFFEKATEATDPSKELWLEYDADDWEELRKRLHRAKELAQSAWHAVRHDDAETAMTKLHALFGDAFPSYG